LAEGRGYGIVARSGGAPARAGRPGRAAASGAEGCCSAAPQLAQGLRVNPASSIRVFARIILAPLTGAEGSASNKANEPSPGDNVRARISILALALGAIAAAPAAAQTQGVSKNEIVVGTIQDLSGPIAAFGKASRNGMQLRFEELNEQGGVNGRKVKLVVDDSSYDPKKAVLAAQKQANSDKVFLSVGNMGTAVSMAAMPIFFEKNVPHLFPITAARQMYEPLHKLKYSFAATYYDQVRSLVRHMTKIKADRKWCVMYQDDDFGQEVVQGAEAGLKENGGRTLVEKTSFKRGATDFSSQAQRMKAAGCDTVVLGTIIRETPAIMAEARKIGWTAEFVGTSASYTHLVPLLGKDAVNGLISAHTVAHPYLDDASDRIRHWAQKYKTRFNEDPDVFSVYGYMIADLTISALSRAGANLTTDSFVKALDSTTYKDPLFGADTSTFTPTKHLGTNKSRMSQIRNGRWVVISEYVEP
jgi:branched-chain amino acid transport system substrate-binding protein